MTLGARCRRFDRRTCGAGRSCQVGFTLAVLRSIKARMQAFWLPITLRQPSPSSDSITTVCDCASSISRHACNTAKGWSAAQWRRRASAIPSPSAARRRVRQYWRNPRAAPSVANRPCPQQSFRHPRPPITAATARAPPPPTKCRAGPRTRNSRLLCDRGYAPHKPSSRHLSRALERGK